MTAESPVEAPESAPRTGWRRYAPGGAGGAVIAAVILLSTIAGVLMLRPSPEQLAEPVDVPVQVEARLPTGNPGPEPPDVPRLAGVADIVVRGIVHDDATFRVTHVLANHTNSAVETITIQLRDPLPTGAEEILFLTSRESPNSRAYNADVRAFKFTSVEGGHWTVSGDRVLPTSASGGSWSLADFNRAVKNAPNPRDAAVRLLRHYGFSPARPDAVAYLRVQDIFPPGSPEESASADIGLRPIETGSAGVVLVAWLASVRDEPGVSAYVLVSGKEAVAGWAVADKTGKVYSLRQRTEAFQAAR